MLWCAISHRSHSRLLSHRAGGLSTLASLTSTSLLPILALLGSFPRRPEHHLQHSRVLNAPGRARSVSMCVILTQHMLSELPLWNGKLIRFLILKYGHTCVQDDFGLELPVKC